MLHHFDNKGLIIQVGLTRRDIIQKVNKLMVVVPIADFLMIVETEHDILEGNKDHHGVLLAESCPTLSDPMDCGPPGSSVHGIFQARVLEWGAIAFSSMDVRVVL